MSSTDDKSGRNPQTSRRKKAQAPLHDIPIFDDSKGVLSTELTARWAEQTQQFRIALNNAETGLRGLYEIATGPDDGMAASAARELLTILTNTLLALNSPTTVPGKLGIWAGEGPNPDPTHLGEPVWPAAFKSLARKRENWPVLYELHADRHELFTENAISGFEVGSDTGINLEGKRFSRLAAANIAVLEIKDYIERFCEEKFHGEISIVGGQNLSDTKRAELKLITKLYSR